MRRWLFGCSAVLILSSGVAGRAERAAAPLQQAAGSVIQSQDANAPGVVAELMECKRKDGVLSLRVRLRNTSNAPVKMQIINGRNFDDYYVTAGSKKYFILRDEEGTALAPAASPFGGIGIEIAKGGSWTWWAKYPAPPDTETKHTNITPLAGPFEDVPIGR